MINSEITIRRVWRSQIKRIVIYLVLSIASVVLSRQIPGSIIQGKLIDIGSLHLYLSLPLFSLLPLIALFSLVVPIYDAYLLIDNRGIEMTSGILSLNLVTNRVRFEDIRGIELEQKLIERALNVGTIGIGSAATDGIEILMPGVGAPRDLQEMIQAERDARQKAESAAGHALNPYSQSSVGD